MNLEAVTKVNSKNSKESKLPPLKDNPVLSICIPAYNEAGNIGKTIATISSVMRANSIPFELVIANDNSKDDTESVIRAKMEEGIPIRLINRIPPGGFGRALRSCLQHFHGDIVVIVMADMSDDPQDIVCYYKMINLGYDAVFGSRFIKGSVVTDYPRIKLFANRFGNTLIQLLFFTKHNDLTNSFKAYRAEALRSIVPLYSSHFNLTIELSLGILTRGFKIAQMPINWYGRTWGRANFKIRELGRRYFATLLKAYAEKIFIHDDLIAEHERTLALINEGALINSAQILLSEIRREEVFTNITDEEDISNRGSRVCRL
jgi:dolichol-phosphate mannosyltransferase